VKKVLFAVLILLCYSRLIPQNNGGIVTSETYLYPENQVIVTYNLEVSERERTRFERENSLHKLQVCPRDNWVSFRTDGKVSIKRLTGELKKSELVLRAQPNYYFHISWVPNDPYYSFYQWNLRRIAMEDAWDIEQGGDTSIIVGVLDTGCAFEDYPVPSYEKDKIDSNTVSYKRLPDYDGGHFLSGFDFVNNDAHPNDNHSHGTHVTSTIMESTNNGSGLAGIAFNVAILPVKVVNWVGIGTADLFALGVYYAADHDVDIINISLASSGNPGQIVKDAIDYAASKGVIMVAGVGNSGAGSVTYPAKYDEIIAVSATCSSVPDSLAYYSNFGSGVEVSAPGGDLVDRDSNGFPDLIVQQAFLPGIFNNGFAKPDSFVLLGYGGTSMAAPHITGVIALMLSHGIPRENIREVLHQTAVDCGDVGYDTLFGYGRIDCFRALGGEDTVPPLITETTVLEDTYFAGPYAVWSRVSDLFGIKDARIWYKINSGGWQDSVYADKIYPDKYLFYIPEVTPPAVIKYYIEATDNSDNTVTDPDGAPTYYYSFIVLESGIEEVETEKECRILCPSFVRSDMLMLKFSRTPQTSFIISLYDISGRLVRSINTGRINNKELPLNISALESGIYFLKLKAKSEKLNPIRKKFSNGANIEKVRKIIKIK